MNEDFFGKWNEVKGKVKEKWEKLSDDDLTQINGKKEHLLGTLQTKYGWEQQKAEEEIKIFEKIHCKDWKSDDENKNQNKKVS
jgi:uncharacterized protein YjbJ (UPF0337 family)